MKANKSCIQWNCAIYSNVDGPKDCNTQWSKSEKQILYNNACMWNLEKWCRQSYLQSWNRHADVENKCKDTKGERGTGGMTWEIGTDTRTPLLLCRKWISSENRLYSTRKSTRCFVATWLGSKSIKDRICTCRSADSLCCTAQTQHCKATISQCFLKSCPEKIP